MIRPLDGIRVVDFGWVAVGPVLSILLAELREFCLRLSPLSAMMEL